MQSFPTKSWRTHQPQAVGQKHTMGPNYQGYPRSTTQSHSIRRDADESIRNTTVSARLKGNGYRGSEVVGADSWNRHSLLIFLVPFDLQWHQNVFNLLAARQHEAFAWCFHKNPEAKHTFRKKYTKNHPCTSTARRKTDCCGSCG